MPQTRAPFHLVPSASLAPTVAQARAYANQATAPATRRAYRTAFADFKDWCVAQNLAALPADPAAIGLFLAARAATHKASSLLMRLVAIRQAHRAAGYHLDASDPAIRNVLQGIARVHGRAVRKKEAATAEVLRDALRALPVDSVKGLRDRALLLLGFYAALRRSELSGLDVQHVTFAPEGVVIFLPRRKTDQEGQGSEIAVLGKPASTQCPVAALRAWVDAAAISNGPLFRPISRGGRVLDRRLCDRDVARMVKAAVARAGYDPEVFGGHSLRAGFATSAGRQNVPERVIMLQTGHKSVAVLRGYIRRGGLFTDNATQTVTV